MKTVDKYYLYIEDPNEPVGVYPGACQGPDRYYFDSISEARSSNCHGVYADKVKYKIGKMQIRHTPVDFDLDPPSSKEINDAKIKAEADAIRDAKMDVWRKEWIAKYGEAPNAGEEMNYQFVLMVDNLFAQTLTDVIKKSETNPS